MERRAKGKAETMERRAKGKAETIRERNLTRRPK